MFFPDGPSHQMISNPGYGEGFAPTQAQREEMTIPPKA